jgi:hypothetical protein
VAKSKAARKRYLERQRRRLGQRHTHETANAGLKQIYAEIPARVLSDRLTIVLAQDGVLHKTAAIFFRKQTADLYIALPYLRLGHYTCGILEGVRGETKTTDTASGATTSRRPVKLSYHERGQVHARVQDRLDQRILAQVQAPEIARLSGEHIFTLELEGRH